MVFRCHLVLSRAQGGSINFSALSGIINGAGRCQKMEWSIFLGLFRIMRNVIIAENLEDIQGTRRCAVSDTCKLEVKSAGERAEDLCIRAEGIGLCHPTESMIAEAIADAEFDALMNPELVNDNHGNIDARYKKQAKRIAMLELDIETIHRIAHNYREGNAYVDDLLTEIDKVHAEIKRGE